MKSTLGLAPPRRGVALALMIAAPVLWSTAGVVTRHIERATAFEQVFWRSLFACIFVAGTVLFRTWVAAAVAAAGIAWMFGFSVRSPEDVAGMLVALLVPLAAAANVITLRAVAARLDLAPAVMMGAALSSLIALPLALPLQASARDVGLLAFLGFFQLGLPCILMVLASRRLLAPEIALLGLLEVILGPL